MRDLTIQMTVLTLAAGGAGAAVVVRAARRQRADLSAVLRALVVSGALVGAGLVVAVASGIGPFGVAHLLYLAVVVTVPIIGTAVLGGRVAARASTAAVVAGAVMLVPVPVGVYATHVAPYRLVVDHERVHLPQERAGDDPVRIAILSDLQTTGVGEHERAAVRAVQEARPDVILIPGDLFQGTAEQLREEAPAIRELLRSLDAPGGVYFVEGDVDRGDRIDVLLPGTGVEVLDDRVHRVRIGDRRLVIGGTRKDHSSPAAAQVRRDLVAAAGAEEVTILVSHRPDTVLDLPPSSGVDLTVAGHTHGGQLALPLIGPLVTLSSVPRHVGAGGLHEVDGNRIYVSTGVGMERGAAPQLRLGVPPSVAVIDLVDGP